MAIDVLNETLLSFQKLAQLIPPMRNDRPVHVSTIHRWRVRGVKGVRLEATRVGGSWHTSREAFARFCGQLSSSQMAQTNASELSQTVSGSTQRADTRLKQIGW